MEINDLLRAVDLKAVLQRFGVKFTGRNRAICPWCGGASSKHQRSERTSLAIFNHNQENIPIYQCKKAQCDERGNAITAAEKLGGLDFQQSMDFLKDFIGIKSEERSPEEENERKEKLNVYYDKCLENKEHQNIKGLLDRRKISVRIQAVLKEVIGYDTKHNAAVFPIKDLKGDLVALHLMKSGKDEIFDHGNNKKNLGEISDGFFWATSTIEFPKPIILVEGVIDALSIASIFPQHTVIATIGLGTERVKRLIEERARNMLIVCFDNDEAGKKAARGLAVDLEKVKVVNFDLFSQIDDEGNVVKTYNDVNDIKMDEQDEMIKEIISNPKTVYGITVTLEDNGVIYYDDKGRMKIKPYNLVKWICKEAKIVTMQGDLVYKYNGKYYELIDKDAFFKLLNINLKMDKYRELIAGQNRANIWNFLFDQTYELNSIELEEQNKGYLTLNNCLLNLENQETIDHTSSIFTTNCLEFDYIPSASSTEFLSYLVSTFDRDRETIKYVQEILGYIFYKGLPRPALFFFLGMPGTGKSTFLDIIELLIGTKNCSHVSLKDMKKQDYLAKMKDRLVNQCGEVSRQQELDDTILKAVSDGTTVTARFLYQNAFEFEPYAKQCFGMNEFPQFIDNTFALYDRIYVLTFNHVFRHTGEEKIELHKQFTNDDFSGTLNWALKGLRRLKQNNFIFSVPEKMEKAKEEEKMSNDPAYAFFKDCIMKQVGYRLRARFTYLRYEKYIEGNYDRRQLLNYNDFRKRLISFGIRNYHPQNISSWQNVDWTEEAENYRSHDEIDEDNS